MINIIICDAFRHLGPFIQVKKHEKHPWRSVTFRKVACLCVCACVRACVRVCVSPPLLQLHFFGRLRDFLTGANKSCNFMPVSPV